jgi:hypothetical protein
VLRPLSPLIFLGALACGSDLDGRALCERNGQTNARFFAGRSECSAMVDGATVVLEAGAGSRTPRCDDVPTACADDLGLLEDFTVCREQRTPCTPGNEEAAVRANQECNRILFKPSGGGLPEVSLDCATAWFGPVE